jgi:phosphoribosylformimino-5-aminoimidazole carboxamide ribotide isomerase/phosphoribosylanthranilate isomerase
VDLDAAFGRGNNQAMIKKVIKSTPKRVNVELSGGIRDDESLKAALATGAKRINLGTAALENPEWAAHVIAEYGEAIAVGLDVRGTTLAARGWTQEGGDLWTVLERLEAAGCCRYVVTDVTKDGTLQGPNVELLRQVMDRTHRPVIASGGVASLDDLIELRELVPLGLEGAIVGKALYAKEFTLAEALDVSSQ